MRPMSNIMRSDSDNKPWFALRVKPNHEKSVSSLMEHQGFEEFLPICRVRRRWGQRWQNVDTPLFPGYVFSRFERHDWTCIINTPGVIDAVRFGSALAPVDPDEIQALQLVQRAKTDMQPSAYLQPGQSFRVTAGPLAGVKGTLIETKGVTRLLLSVTILQRSVLVEIDRNWVACDPIPQPALQPRLHA